MGKKKTKGLTSLQRETLEEICQHWDQYGYAPSVQELADKFGVAPPSMQDRINQLVSKGYLNRIEKKARSLTVVKRPSGMTADIKKLVAVPLVGTVAAGVPILAIENIVGEVLVSQAVVGNAECFALSVQGDSMIKADINDGDTIVVQRQPLAENGDIVVAMLDDEVTVKRLHIESGTIELVPENPRLKPIPIHPDDDFKIVGRVVACLNK